MRTKLLLAATAALISINASAHDAGTERVTVVGAQPAQVQGLPMSAMTFAGVQGHYVLDDGRRLHVTGKGARKERRLYADIGNGPVELVRVGEHRFVGADRGLDVSFDDYDGARPATVLMNAPR